MMRLQDMHVAKQAPKMGPLTEFADRYLGAGDWILATEKTLSSAMRNHEEEFEKDGVDSIREGVKYSPFNEVNDGEVLIVFGDQSRNPVGWQSGGFAFEEL